MKHYTIKPLEWREDHGWHYSRNGWIISRSLIRENYSYTLTVDNAFVYSNIESVEQAKDLAETLHEHELAKYLQEVE